MSRPFVRSRRGVRTGRTEGLSEHAGAVIRIHHHQLTSQRRASTGLAELGDYRFNVALGESQSLEFAELVTAARMAEFVAHLPHSANSGDIYARLPA